MINSFLCKKKKKTQATYCNKESFKHNQSKDINNIYSYKRFCDQFTILDETYFHTLCIFLVWLLDIKTGHSFHDFGFNFFPIKSDLYMYTSALYAYEEINLKKMKCSHYNFTYYNNPGDKMFFFIIIIINLLYLFYFQQ